MSFVPGKKTDSFFYPVHLYDVGDSGASIIYRFEFRFKRLSRSKINALQRQQESKSDTDVDSLERDTDYVMDIADGWKGVDDLDGTPLPFTRDSVYYVLDAYPSAAGEIVKAFFEATLGGGRKTKN